MKATNRPRRRVVRPAVSDYSMASRRAAVDVLVVLSASVDAGVDRLRSIRSRENSKAIDGQIRYWTNVSSGLRWAAGVVRQVNRSQGRGVQNGASR